MRLNLRLAILMISCLASIAEAQTTRATKSREVRGEGFRYVLDISNEFDALNPTHLLIFANPNGNTIEETLGGKLTPGMSWRYDIQHVGAQTRLLQELFPDQNLVLACTESNTLSWPAFRAAHADNPGRIRGAVESIKEKLPTDNISVTFACHSGGGAFLWGFINSAETIPDDIDRLVWIDANYSFSDEEGHGEKLIEWLKRDPLHTLVVIAYDDRNITLNGKKVVSDTGGTWRATHRMIDRFSKDMELKPSKLGEIDEWTAMDGQVHFMLHPNRENKILHTVLVERNGLVEAVTLNTPIERQWDGSFWGGRAYAEYIEEAKPAMGGAPATRATQAIGGAIPPRPANAPSGKAFAEQIADLPMQAREQAIVQEALKGNIPDFLRDFVPINVKAKTSDGKTHECVLQVMPDYFAIGSDDDFVRMPMTPQSATQVANAFGCILPTRKLVNDIYEQASVKLEPRPLTEAREAVETFVEHNQLIEKQRGDAIPGRLIAGIKKDVVLSNRLKEQPSRVAIYGWHKLDGKPIQPLYVGHVDRYVDYSHGIRLIRDEVMVDGKAMSLDELLRDAKLSVLVSDEGPIDARYEP